MYTINLTNGKENKSISFSNPNQGTGIGGTIAKGMVARRMRPGLGRAMVRGSQIRGMAQHSQGAAQFSQAKQEVTGLIKSGYKPVAQQDNEMLMKFFGITL